MADVLNSPGIGHRVDAITEDLRDLLQCSLRFPSISGEEGPFTRFIADWAAKAGFEIDLWQSSESELAAYPLSGRSTCRCKGARRW